MGKDPDQIEKEIEETRERIGDRIDALSYKADVKGRVSDTIAEKREQATERVGDLVSEARERLSSATEQSPSAEDLKYQTRRGAGIVRKYPLSLAIGAAALGFGLGWLLGRKT